MKKLFFILLVLLSLTSFFGCGFNETFKEDPNLKTVSGILSEQNEPEKFPGTHFIIQNNEKIALRSLILNLSSPEYLNNKVEVYGSFNTKDKVFEVTGISVKEVIVQNDEKSGFIVYKNTDFGVELKYYSDWEVEETDDTLTFSAPIETGKIDSDKVKITKSSYESVPQVNEDGTVIDPLIVYVNEFFPNIETPEDLLRKVGVENNFQVIEMKNEDENFDYYFYRNSLIYKFYFVPSVNFENLEKNLNVFKKMLSEFAFIGFTVEDNALEQEDVTENPEGNDIKTDLEQSAEQIASDLNEMAAFESVSYAFKGKYPSNWYYAGSSSQEKGVLRHYGFSDKPEGDVELISLDVVSEDIPKNAKTFSFVGPNTIYKLDKGGISEIYSKDENGQVYRLKGDKEYIYTMSLMASSLQPIEKE